MPIEKTNLKPISVGDEDPRSNLAIERTTYALERTQLAWIRTTLTFLGSGIALDKGMEYIHRARLESGKALFENAHVVSISLSAGGTLLLAVNAWFCLKRFRSLSLLKREKAVQFPPVLWASLLMILLGMVVTILLLIT